MLQNVAAHNVRVPKRKCHIMYSVTKHIPLQIDLSRLCNVHLKFCDAVCFVTLYVTFMFCHFYVSFAYVVCSYVK
jgi:hypothetical protein